MGANWAMQWSRVGRNAGAFWECAGPSSAVALLRRMDRAQRRRRFGPVTNHSTAPRLRRTPKRSRALLATALQKKGTGKAPSPSRVNCNLNWTCYGPATRKYLLPVAAPVNVPLPVSGVQVIGAVRLGVDCNVPPPVQVIVNPPFGSPTPLMTRPTTIMHGPDPRKRTRLQSP